MTNMVSLSAVFRIHVPLLEYFPVCDELLANP